MISERYYTILPTHLVVEAALLQGGTIRDVLKQAKLLDRLKEGNPHLYIIITQCITLITLLHPTCPNLLIPWGPTLGILVLG